MYALLHVAILAMTVFLLARLLPDVRLRGAGTAVVVAIVFSVLNFFLGWLIRAVLFVPALLTLGLLFLFVPFIVNMVLLWLTDKLLASFEIAAPAVCWSLRRSSQRSTCSFTRRSCRPPREVAPTTRSGCDGVTVRRGPRDGPTVGWRALRCSLGRGLRSLALRASVGVRCEEGRERETRESQRRHPHEAARLACPASGRAERRDRE